MKNVRLSRMISIKFYLLKVLKCQAMFAAVRLFFLTLLLVGCYDDRQGGAGEPMKIKEFKPLSELSSGYVGESADWVEFIICWKSSQVKYTAPKMLKFNESSKKEVNKFRSGKVPSASYYDFIKEYGSLGGDFLSIKDVNGVGFFNPEDVKTLGEYNPDLAKVDAKWVIESGDDDYYQYGTEQDTSSGRNSYLYKSVVLGKYGESAYELILIYPNSVTSDGEAETAIISHAGEFRAPSFAEMMRQLSILFLEKRDVLPPYPEKEASSSACGKNIKLTGVWWK